ncbi:hypothetical protein SAG0165_04970 [Streptococcus agalactiae MRI Z1-217]|uniref:Uncharacterized protein n=1 Tax=Streptococcus agalactiae MRI Z1-216 TaxID=1154879 RepID=A0AAD3A338_STRAG|nr:hypothetical protein SAG0161_00955 [Streptococcus agalactiae MRI Z1-213]EPU38343.1 hypothetical protein SAG0164_01850 [Streptococcus agalactiae MRI Z1-216]EPX07423.1 hypothetical protein SAG0165_04970 [Streptococcus agalactiae MRI Z1-217]CNC27091.1 Uncharacterised protein [Streptococcus agalactiae]
MLFSAEKNFFPMTCPLNAGIFIIPYTNNVNKIKEVFYEEQVDKFYQ